VGMLMTDAASQPTTTVDMSHMTREDLVAFRRHLLGVVAMIDRLLNYHLTGSVKSCKG
jgi:hypothetical protein